MNERIVVDHHLWSKNLDLRRPPTQIAPTVKTPAVHLQCRKILDLRRQPRRIDRTVTNHVDLLPWSKTRDLRLQLMRIGPIVMNHVAHLQCHKTRDSPWRPMPIGRTVMIVDHLRCNRTRDLQRLPMPIGRHRIVMSVNVDRRNPWQTRALQRPWRPTMITCPVEASRETEWMAIVLMIVVDVEMIGVVALTIGVDVMPSATTRAALEKKSSV